MLDNIGLPYSGINIALSDTATVGSDGRRDPDLAERKAYADAPRTSPSCGGSCRSASRNLTFFFQPADIVNQVLNFGQPAPIDIRVSGPKQRGSLRAGARRSRAISTRVPGVVDSHVFQVPDAPAMTVDVDRDLGARAGPDPASGRQQRAGDPQFTARRWRPISGSIRATSVSYPLRGADADLPNQLGAGSVDAAGDLAAAAKDPQLLMNVATFGREPRCR